jgi:fatty acid elongase 3
LAVVAVSPFFVLLFTSQFFARLHSTLASIPRSHTMSKPDWIQVGVPTLDRPFGLQLWPIFEKVYESMMGYKPQDFRFVPGETPISTIKSCTAILVSYYIIIFGGRELMRNREPFKFSFLFKLHNFYLTAISAILLGLFLEQIIPTVARHGLFFAVCDHAGGWTDKMVILYYVGAPQRGARIVETGLTGRS